MAIEIADIDGGIGNIIIGKGVLTGKEYVDTHKRHLTQDKDKFEQYRFSLSDWTEVTQLDIPTKDIEIVVRLCEDASAANPNAVVAIVGDQDLLYGLGRMFEMLAQETRQRRG